MDALAPGDEVMFTIGRTERPATARKLPEPGSHYYTVMTGDGTRWSVTAAALSLLAKAGAPR